MNTSLGGLGSLSALIIFSLAATGRAAPEADGWQALFDGRSLDGWRANEGQSSFQVVDGAIVCNGPRSHLFYVGPISHADFGDFEFEAEVMTRPGANSGVYFHTGFQERDWPVKGYEVQVNSTATGEGGYRENKRTGSLYGVRNVYRPLVPDDRWFTLRIAVRGRRITVHVNAVQTVDYVEPPEAPNAGYRDRRLASGTFALQCHDPGSWVQYRKLRVRFTAPEDGPRPDVAPHVVSKELADLYANNFPVIDLHTHLKGGLTMSEVVQRQFRSGINAGVAVNCGVGFAITNDAGIDRAMGELRHPLVYAGMQAEGREWLELFSREAIARFDYVFTDAMTIQDASGKRMRLWLPDEVEVGEVQAFMNLLVKRTLEILEGEPIHIWVNPTFLPASIAGRYDELWTEPRMQSVIEAAVRRGIAIEINDRFQIPSSTFIRLAKRAGAMFTFGTNNGGRDDLGRLDYGVRMVRECGLAWQDFWVPLHGSARFISQERGSSTPLRSETRLDAPAD